MQLCKRFIGLNYHRLWIGVLAILFSLASGIGVAREKPIIIGGGVEGGRDYRSAAALARLMARQGLQVLVAPIAQSRVRLAQLKSGKIDLAIISGGDDANANSGEKFIGLRSLVAIEGARLVVLVPANSPIRTAAQLRNQESLVIDEQSLKVAEAAMTKATRVKTYYSTKEMKNSGGENSMIRRWTDWLGVRAVPMAGFQKSTATGKDSNRDLGSAVKQILEQELLPKNKNTGESVGQAVEKFTEQPFKSETQASVTATAPSTKTQSPAANSANGNSSNKAIANLPKTSAKESHLVAPSTLGKNDKKRNSYESPIHNALAAVTQGKIGSIIVNSQQPITEITDYALQHPLRAISIEKIPKSAFAIHSFITENDYNGVEKTMTIAEIQLVLVRNTSNINWVYRLAESLGTETAKNSHRETDRTTAYNQPADLEIDDANFSERLKFDLRMPKLHRGVLTWLSENHEKAN